MACDGSYDKGQGTVRLSTNSFTVAEVQQLQSILLNKFGIESTTNVVNKAKEQSPPGEGGRATMVTISIILFGD